MRFWLDVSHFRMWKYRFCRLYACNKILVIYVINYILYIDNHHIWAIPESGSHTSAELSAHAIFNIFDITNCCLLLKIREIFFNWSLASFLSAGFNHLCNVSHQIGWFKLRSETFFWLAVVIDEEFLEIPCNVCGSHRRIQDVRSFVDERDWVWTKRLQPSVKFVFILAIYVPLHQQGKRRNEVVPRSYVLQPVQNFLPFSRLLVAKLVAWHSKYFKRTTRAIKPSR